ncbi:protein of unknown function [Candidatus Nitrosacidococcus tergens]|uniref:Uncharacterized protein n=1 Tax=Candidatus Nitrosacidococcus tergens TaxID=553981 RepID=A0A7G1QA48_9GAMM|nr:protein of unknown function [Candidatus Nitrosacidococcus tergens]
MNLDFHLNIILSQPILVNEVLTKIGMSNKAFFIVLFATLVE